MLMLEKKCSDLSEKLSEEQKKCSDLSEKLSEEQKKVLILTEEIQQIKSQQADTEKIEVRAIYVFRCKTI